MNALIQQFDTEDDYWKYDETAYEKGLPIQKIVGDLQKNITKKISLQHKMIGITF